MKESQGIRGNDVTCVDLFFVLKKDHIGRVCDKMRTVA
jgi:hypothetical protein